VGPRGAPAALVDPRLAAPPSPRYFQAVGPVRALSGPSRRSRRTAVSGFRNEDEFRRVFEQIFTLMNEHPEVGRTLRDARAPHRFEITDYGLEFNVTHADETEAAGGRYLRWCWGPADWEPTITLKMASDVANRFFQGKENIALAVAMGRVKLGGPLSRILELAPVTRPIHPVYREWLRAEGYDHLVA
jgi:hypothetical protein